MTTMKKARRVQTQCACCERRRVCEMRPTADGKEKAYFCDRCARTCGPGGCEVT